MHVVQSKEADDKTNRITTHSEQSFLVGVKIALGMLFFNQFPSAKLLVEEVLIVYTQQVLALFTVRRSDKQDYPRVSSHLFRNDKEWRGMTGLADNNNRRGVSIAN